jgi:RNA polymerase sigma factor (TIGR02999 family)
MVCCAAEVPVKAEGEGGKAADFLTEVYADLKAVAAGYFRREWAGHTLQPTAVVHEAYARLSGKGTFKSRTHFMLVASTTMRRVLVDHARRRLAKKRGGGKAGVTIADVADSAESVGGGGIDVLELDDALVKMEGVYPRPARVVELRFFGGLRVEDTARLMGLSVATVESDWRFARAWLTRELRGEVS